MEPVDNDSLSQGNNSSAGESELSAKYEDSTTSGSASGGSSNGGNRFSANAPIRIAEKESKRVFRSKVLVILVLMVSAAAVGVAAYYATRRQEQNEFLVSFDSSAQKLINFSKQKTTAFLKSFDSITLALTGYAIGLEATWPQVTIVDFAAQLDLVRQQTRADWVNVNPLVKESEREDFEAWATDNQAWVEVSMQYEGSLQEGQPAPRIPANISPLSEDPEAIYTPSWHLMPVSNYVDTVLHDTLQMPIIGALLESLKQVPYATFSEFVYSANTTLPDDNDDLPPEEWPRTFLAQPVFDRPPNAGETNEDLALVGMFNSLVPWDSFFEKLLPETTPPGLIVVLKNSCGQISTLSYRVDGPDVTFLGQADMTNPNFEHVTDTSMFTSLVGCDITVVVSPSEEYQETFLTYEPVIYLCSIIGIFIIAGISFLIYDNVVERRQRKVMLKVEKSNAIVNSLFPSQVRDRLIEGRKGADSGFKTGRSLADKAMEKAFHTSARHDSGEDSFQLAGSKPIADLYPHATVMFADIANFTSWSSVREPTQVFTLLEAVYSSFDRIAKQKRVFKVETIGDSYVAAAGVPEARKDHAIVMARFARDCLMEMQDIVLKLEVFLGPDTADLEIRIGLNSGPVTAGVLRGEKARFQLFGDTVNTAARMESTGEKSRIQASEATANLLIKAEKSHWVVPREELVSAKGKGTMQTFWLEFKRGNNIVGGGGDSVSDDNASCNGSYTNGSSNGDSSLGGDFVVEGLPKPTLKHERLVNWNVEILMRLLQKMVAMRSSSNSTLDDSKGDSTPSVDGSRHAGDLFHETMQNGMALDEVKEIIQLNNKKAKLKRDPNSISLGPVVESQLRDFVKTISNMYRQNPFHNFEHASHVSQSLAKLLSRIVVTDTIDYKDMTYKKKAATSALHDSTFGITSDPLIEFSCALSALIHDVDHPGVPNARLVLEEAEIATHYRNKSVAEQNSVDLAWDLLMEPKYRELRCVIYTNQTELDRFRQLIINSVMATDIADKELGQLRKKRWEKAFAESTSLEEEAPLDCVNRKATIVIEHLIQAADVAHTMQHWHVFLKWNERLFREVYQAYLNGRSDTDPSEGWYKGELGFFDFYVIPLAKKLDNCGVFGVSSDECLEYAKANRQEWEQKGESIVEGYLEFFRLK